MIEISGVLSHVCKILNPISHVSLVIDKLRVQFLMKPDLKDIPFDIWHRNHGSEFTRGNN